ncbi:MAG: glucose-6-phosphate isomerase [Candidatus Eisenbacteria bacterium]|uniref:Glucose-6-phosphate isomerase n=1 Tax=Eiseniibacteriota bacterium TaxID=2212470 RepID=A0A948W5G9_UNCEI|nr:glucose-6-phosphate isomerase [Candidatus Eisenbacteria bacterium]MBU1950096.1 glucose-6-phosphate isomerase [Candidatus Eisenbacteria bacterium]MBU2690399.1 glucose-6-phosphate isomerase [Candidatus Eisenbacteria bacterium]
MNLSTFNEENLTFDLGPYTKGIGEVLDDMAAEEILPRIWSFDHTVWKPDPREITNRLGWLLSPAGMREAIPGIKDTIGDLRRDGCTHAILMGMGGSSLAPEVFGKVFGNHSPLSTVLTVVDTTDPDAIHHETKLYDPATTLYIVSTKSGSTVETFSLFKHFWRHAVKKIGTVAAGGHFIAITDQGSMLEEMATRLKFRRIFLNDPNIGGRFSVLSHFGLVPAAMVGADPAKLLDRAIDMARHCGADGETTFNPGARLGAVLGELARLGRDKMTLLLSPVLAPFGAWVEQLIAESTGKDGRGILPVACEPAGPPEMYSDDRVFVEMRLEHELCPAGGYEKALREKHPWIRILLKDEYDLGAQFFLWEMATAVAGHCLEIQPFDQPDVESAKIAAREMVDAYMREGALPQSEPLLQEEGLQLFGDGEPCGGWIEHLRGFLMQSSPHSYIALQAYLEPTGKTTQFLTDIAARIRSKFNMTVTTGYGPRYLHSTGQLHKGDRGNGLFVQFTSDPRKDVPIPDEIGSDASSISFGVLKAAQALGDGEALRRAGRKVLRIHLGDRLFAGLETILKGLS